MSSPEKTSVAPVRSMTGYAVIRRQTEAGVLTASLRSVNHRGLDLHFHLGAELAPFENSMRAVLKQHIGRGHIEIRSFLARDADPAGVFYNRDLVARYIDAFRQAAKEYQLFGEPDLNQVLGLPGAMNAQTEIPALDDRFESEVTQVIKTCVEELNSFRGREGRELVAELHVEIDRIERNTAEILNIRTGAVQQLQERLRDRLLELLANSGISEMRLAEEAAVLADRSDVQEELTRLRVHAQELRSMLDGGGEVGKRIDFLLQEMNRETNTVLSKTSGIGESGLGVTKLALGTKAHIEKIREQALNLE